MVLALRHSALILFLACVAGAASAAPPRPAASVPLRLYSGRWYEIARTPNFRERGCKLPTSAFTGMANGAFEVVETCPRASGPPRVSKLRAALITGSRNAKFRMNILGGLIHPEFWILATAPSGDWAIMGTPGGHYVWVLSRTPTLPAAENADVVAKVAALGYPTAKLVYD